MTDLTTRQHRPSAAARRQKLLQATVEVAAQVGIAGVTHRAVAEQAGLPLATVSYFFDSIDALIEEALRARNRAGRARADRIGQRACRCEYHA